MKPFRAKVYVTGVAGSESYVNVTLQPVTSSNKPYGPNGENEDNSFARYTPSGKVELGISNPELAKEFKLGDTFYVDFTPVE